MSAEDPHTQRDTVGRNVRRLVGLNVLRRLNQMLQVQRATEAANARWVQRWLWFFAALMALLVALMLRR